jgi:cell division protein YceG involved in septum cleavage
MTVTDAALRAAAHPANAPYLYYVTGRDGITRFATTLAEHDQNIRAHGVRGE